MTEVKKSGVKGVYWQKNAECWVVKVYESLEEGGKKKQKYIGRSKDLEEAKKILEDHKSSISIRFSASTVFDGVDKVGGKVWWDTPENYQKYLDRCETFEEKYRHLRTDLKNEPAPAPLHAENYLRRSIYALNQRARAYDAPGGEKSIGKTVELFNNLTGNSLSESHGWLFMVCLKLVRSQQGEFKMDNFVDLAAYAALYGESQEKEVPEPVDEEYDAMELAVNT